MNCPPFSAVNARVGTLSLLDDERRHVLYQIALNTAPLQGQVVEAGVYRGGSALLLAQASSKPLHLFDTFAGLPFHDPERDVHVAGQFADTSREAVAQLLDGYDAVFHVGPFHDTFLIGSLPSVSLAHIDCDLYESVRECCEFLYPRMTTGGFMVFDDYGFNSCPGAKLAVDEFFEHRPEVPIVLPTRQAIVVKQ